MLIKFGAARTAADLPHFRDLHDQPFGDQSNAVAFGQ